MKDSPYLLLKSQYYLPLIVYFAAEFTLGFIFFTVLLETACLMSSLIRYQLKKII